MAAYWDFYFGQIILLDEKTDSFREASYLNSAQPNSKETITYQHL